MRKIFFISVFCLITVSSVRAQTVERVEYFFDTDPGYGNGTAISISPAATITSFAVDIPVTGISEGFHTLHIRAQDDKGLWTTTHWTTIYKLETANGGGGSNTSAEVAYVEYFYDTDPGYGNGIALAITPGQSLSGLAFNLPVTDISEGFHTLHIRAQDNKGLWTTTHWTTVYKLEADSGTGGPTIDPELSYLEYFFDTDPGYGSGIEMAITLGQSLSGLAFDLPVTSISEGFHKLYVRGQDNKGLWTTTHWTAIYKLEAVGLDPTLPQADITQVEYFIDTDPGYGSATQISITPAQKIEDIAFDLDVSGLSEAEHFIYVRAKDSNGKWSVVHNSSFSVCFGEVPILNQPSNVNANGFTTSWNAVTGATSYLLDISRDNFETFESGYEGKELFINSETASNLEEGISYQVRVSAVTSCASVYSAAEEVSLPLATPTSQARNLSFQNPTETGFQVSFTAASGSVTGYLVIRKEALSPTFVPANNTSYAVGDVAGDGVVAFNGSGLGFVETTLTANTDYYYDIFAYNSNAELVTYRTEEPLEGEFYTVGSEPLNQAANLTFSSVSGESLVLNYDPSSAADGYLITRRQNNASTFVPEDGVSYEAGTTYGDAVVSYIGPDNVVKDSLLNQITRYYYTVFSFNGADASINYKQDNPLKSDVVTALKAPTVQPTALSFSNLSNSGLDVSFNAASQSVSGYLIIRKASDSIRSEPIYNTFYTAGDLLSDGAEVLYIGLNTTLNESTLEPETQYFYQVFAYAVDTEFISYNLVEPLNGAITTFAAEPTAQATNLSLVAVTDSSASIQFDNTAGISTKVLLTRTLSDQTASLPIDGTSYVHGDFIDQTVVLFSGDTLAFRDDSISAGTAYTYQVFTYNGQGEAGNYNTTIESNSLSVLSLPEAPSNIETTAVTTSTFDLQLNEPLSATSYLIDVSQDNFTTYVEGYESKQVASASFSVTELEAGTDYQVRVKAQNTSGSSDYSEPHEQKTLSVAPTALSSEEVTQTGFLLRWDTVFGAASYSLDISTDNFATTEATYSNRNISANSIVVEGLVAGLNYQIRLRSENSAGTSANSEVFSQLLIPANPVAVDATNTTSSSFKAKWDPVVGATTYFIDVSLTSASFDPPLADFTNFEAGDVTELLVTGLNPNTPFSYRVRAVNEAGVSFNSNVISLSTLVQGEGSLPQFSNLTFDPSFNGTNGAISVKITSGIPPFEMTFYTRTIRGEDFSMRILEAGAEQTYITSLAPENFDEIGAEFYFQVKDGNGLTQTSATGYMYNEVSTAQGEVPFTKSGGTLASYEFFSIPYEMRDNLIASVFEEMGTYVKSEWRLVRYQNGQNVDYQGGINRIELGKSYWFNQKGQIKINFDDASTAEANQTVDFVMKLQPGWNQIGNPFTFELSWNAILAYNNSPQNIGILKTYDGDNITFINSDRLLPWSGGFVHNDSEAAIDINIPVLFTNSLGRQASKEWNYELDISNNQWQLPISITQNGYTSKMSAIGMHPESNDLKDFYDDIAVPDWGYRPSLYVEKPAYFNPKFTRDIVSPTDSYTWNLKLVSGVKDKILLSWDKLMVQKLEGELWLYDAKRENIVNMADADSYFITPDDIDLLKVSYSLDGLLIDRDLIGKPYPNPAHHQLSLPIYLLNAIDDIEISAFDMQGRSLGQIYAGSLGQGNHRLDWDIHLDHHNAPYHGLMIIVYRIKDKTYHHKVIIKQ